MQVCSPQSWVRKALQLFHRAKYSQTLGISGGLPQFFTGLPLFSASRGLCFSSLALLRAKPVARMPLIMASADADTVALRSTNNLGDIMFDLSVNFLLYVVLIIVFYMLVRFYLEEDTYSYTNSGYVPVATEDLGDEEVSSPNEDIDGIQLTDLPQVNEERQQLIQESSGPETINNEKKNPPLRSRGSAEFLNIHDSSTIEPLGTKQEVIQRLVICAVGLIASFTIWGVLQERLLSQTYDGVFFENSYGLVFMNRLLGLLLSYSLMVYFEIPWYPTALWEYSFPSVANMLSSWCQYEALRYVSFPVVMLAKATKMLPVMLVGKILNNKSYDSYEYISGAVVAFGLYLFMNATEKLDLSTNVFGDPENVKGAICGVFLLFLYLLFDSSTGQWQSRIFELNPKLSPLQMMFIMNTFSAVFSFITLVHEEQLSSALTFVYDHPKMLVHLFFFCLSNTVGQLFIFYTVKHFGALVFSIIMSLRILLSTLISCFLYSHPINEMGYLGIIIVCGATSFRLLKKMESAGQTLIRWKDIDSEQSGHIFKEWHEHLDI